MSIRLYMDHHVPRTIIEGLRQRGIDVMTAYEDDAATLDEDALLERARQTERVLFSQDRDLLVIASHWLETKPSFQI